MSIPDQLFGSFESAEVSKLVELILVAEATERFEDMCKLVKTLVETKSSEGQELNIKERNLLTVSYKNVVGSQRSSWRTLNQAFDEVDETLIEKYKSLVEMELEMNCKQVITLLVDHVLKIVRNKKDEPEAFYLKMVADYYRYLAEFRQDNPLYKDKSREFYQRAWGIAREKLPETHPTRLGLALNFSVCYYEILKEPEKACELAKKTFDEAIEKLDELKDEDYRDSTLILQLLRDNLALWTSEQAHNDSD